MKALKYYPFYGGKRQLGVLLPLKVRRQEMAAARVRWLKKVRRPHPPRNSGSRKVEKKQ